MKMRILLLTIVAILSITGYAQPTIEWQKAYGGTDTDACYDIKETPDGGYIMLGAGLSEDGDLTGVPRKGGEDIWVVKIDKSGKIEWQKQLGGSQNDGTSSFGNSSMLGEITITKDGGYVLCSATLSKDGDVKGSHGKADAWVVKLRADGSIEWAKCLGGSVTDWARSVKQTTDGGYIVGGAAVSNDGDVSGNKGYEDCRMVKLDKFGNIEWQKCFGGSNYEGILSIIQTKDGHYIAVAYVISKDGDISFHNGSQDAWIIKLDENGNILWEKTIGGSDIDNVYEVIETSDSNYLVAGASSFDFFLPGFHDSTDAIIVKISATGNIIWERAYGGSFNDAAYDIIETNDGQYIFSGSTRSIDGDVTDKADSSLDWWLTALNADGGILWSQTVGSSGQEEAFAIELSSGSAFIVGGTVNGNDGDAIGSGYHPNPGSVFQTDAWVRKYSIPNSINKLGTQENKVTVYPTYTRGTVHITTPHGYAEAAIQLYNIYGQVMRTEIKRNGTDIMLSLTDHPAGNYLLHVTGTHIDKTFRIVYQP